MCWKRYMPASISGEVESLCMPDVRKRGVGLGRVDDARSIELRRVGGVRQRRLTDLCCKSYRHIMELALHGVRGPAAHVPWR